MPKSYNKKIAIITQPLKNNYGGILQNFALQEILKGLNYNPITIDYQNDKIAPLWMFFGSWIKTILLFLFTGRPLHFVPYKIQKTRKGVFEIFLSKYINRTKKVCNYSTKILVNNNIDIVLVGSDQVWRPKYNDCITDMFLKFCARNRNLKRISYAASFGVDEWEFSSKQSNECSILAKKFDAISVREESGVQLCKEYLDVDATWVLDPTLLLKKEDYCEVCKSIPISTENNLVVYVLDMNDSIRGLCASLVNEYGLTLKIFSADLFATLTIPEWIAMFRDASYIVTDSFHGTVFSIIFEKKFKCIYNKDRGVARFDSLLKIHKLGKLDEMREFSLNWLKKALEK